MAIRYLLAAIAGAALGAAIVAVFWAPQAASPGVNNASGTEALQLEEAEEDVVQLQEELARLRAENRRLAKSVQGVPAKDGGAPQPPAEQGDGNEEAVGARGPLFKDRLARNAWQLLMLSNAGEVELVDPITDAIGSAMILAYFGDESVDELEAAAKDPGLPQHQRAMAAALIGLMTSPEALAKLVDMDPAMLEGNFRGKDDLELWQVAMQPTPVMRPYAGRIRSAITDHYQREESLTQEQAKTLALLWFRHQDAAARALVNDQGVWRQYYRPLLTAAKVAANVRAKAFAERVARSHSEQEARVMAEDMLAQWDALTGEQQ
jgi:hypothetical protein